MGRLAEEAMAWEFEQEMRAVDINRLRNKLVKQGVWLTKEGKRIPFEDMTPSHRGNVVRMIERAHGPNSRSWMFVQALTKLGIE